MKYLISSVTIGACLLLSSAGDVFAQNPHPVSPSMGGASWVQLPRAHRCLMVALHRAVARLHPVARNLVLRVRPPTTENSTAPRSLKVWGES